MDAVTQRLSQSPQDGDSRTARLPHEDRVELLLLHPGPLRQGVLAATLQLMQALELIDYRVEPVIFRVSTMEGISNPFLQRPQ